VDVLLLLWSRLMGHSLAKLGPGLTTGVADNDPNGSATYSQAGARIGRMTGMGLAANITEAFPPIVMRSVVLLLLVANTLNVAAMGEVGELVSGVDRHFITLVFDVGSLGLQLFVRYHRYVFFLNCRTALKGETAEWGIPGTSSCSQFDILYSIVIL
jgi:Mn2+/Fe2+ NRAMP family transporter